FSSRRRHTRFSRDWSSDVCSSDLEVHLALDAEHLVRERQVAPDQAAVGALLLLGDVRVRLDVQVVVADLDLRGLLDLVDLVDARSEERRVGKECRSRRWQYD